MEDLTDDDMILVEVMDCWASSTSAADFIRRIMNRNLVVRRKAPCPDNVYANGDVDLGMYRRVTGESQ